MKRIIFAALCAALFCGCGSKAHPPSASRHPSPAQESQPQIPLADIQVPPETARTPEGAIPAPAPLSFSFIPTQKHIDTVGLHLIESFEGYSRCAYWDPFGRVWTVGFGQTRGAYQGFCFTGRAAAEANLKRSVESEYEWAIRGLGVNLNQNEWDALCSFAYNLGAGIFTGSLRASLQRHDPTPMLAYDHAGGAVLAGLARRRSEEVALFRKPAAKPRPASRHDLEARRRALRRVLLRDGCRARKTHRQKLGPTCLRWFTEGAHINRELAR